MPRILSSLLLLPFLALPGAVGCAVNTDATAPPPTINAECNGPEGAAQKYAAAEDAYVDLAGVWDRCASTLTDIPSDVAGVEFDGKFAYFLVPGSGTALVRGSGKAYQRSVQLRVDPQGIVVVLADADGSFTAYSAQITAAPRRIRIENTTTHTYLTLGARF